MNVIQLPFVFLDLMVEDSITYTPIYVKKNIKHNFEMPMGFLITIFYNARQNNVVETYK